MNIRILKPSRKRLKPGDIFVLQVEEGRFVFGRVIRTDASMRFGGSWPLIYVYRVFSADRLQIPPLEKGNLLIAPAIVNRLPWSRGYFETVEHRPLQTEDILPVHCFHSANDSYYDADGKELSGRTEPCGLAGMHSYRTIDILVSQALGIPVQEES